MDNRNQLPLSYVYPHNPVNSQLIATYIKLFLGLYGIDIKVFITHSKRSVSNTKANNIGLSMKDIEKATGWNSSSNFRKFYKRPEYKNVEEKILCYFNRAVSDAK